MKSYYGVKCQHYVLNDPWIFQSRPIFWILSKYKAPNMYAGVTSDILQAINANHFWPTLILSKYISKDFWICQNIFQKISEANTHCCKYTTQGFHISVYNIVIAQTSPCLVRNAPRLNGWTVWATPLIFSEWGTTCFPLVQQKGPRTAWCSPSWTTRSWGPPPRRCSGQLTTSTSLLRRNREKQTN